MQIGTEQVVDDLVLDDPIGELAFVIVVRRVIVVLVRRTARRRGHLIGELGCRFILAVRSTDCEDLLRGIRMSAARGSRGCSGCSCRSSSSSHRLMTAVLGVVETLLYLIGDVRQASETDGQRGTGQVLQCQREHETIEMVPLDLNGVVMFVVVGRQHAVRRGGSLTKGRGERDVFHGGVEKIVGVLLAARAQFIVRQEAHVAYGMRTYGQQKALDDI